MTVLYSFPLRIGTCGIGMTAWHQVHGLLQQGVRVILFCASCEKPLDGLDVLRETMRPLGLKLPIRIIGRKRAKALHDEIVARAIKQIHRETRIDLVHCWPSGALQTLKTARELGIKSMLERPNAHTRYAFDVVGRECARLGVRLPRSHSHAFDAYRLRREEEEFKLADRLLCPSQFVARTFLQMGFSKEKLSLHHYGFEPSQFTFCEGSSARSDNKHFHMAFVGSCEPRKGLHYALDAWLESKACRNGFFYICGRYLRNYRKLLNSKLSHPSIKEVGFLKDVGSLLQKCHVLIHPSI